MADNYQQDGDGRQRLFQYLRQKGVYQDQNQFDNDMSSEEGRKNLWQKMHNGGANVSWETFEDMLKPQLQQSAARETEQAKVIANPSKAVADDNVTTDGMDVNLVKGDADRQAAGVNAGQAGGSAEVQVARQMTAGSAGRSTAMGTGLAGSAGQSQQNQQQNQQQGGDTHSVRTTPSMDAGGQTSGQGHKDIDDYNFGKVDLSRIGGQSTETRTSGSEMLSDAPNQKMPLLDRDGKVVEGVSVSLGKRGISDADVSAAGDQYWQKFGKDMFAGVLNKRLQGLGLANVGQDRNSIFAEDQTSAYLSNSAKMAKATDPQAVCDETLQMMTPDLQEIGVTMLGLNQQGGGAGEQQVSDEELERRFNLLEKPMTQGEAVAYTEDLDNKPLEDVLMDMLKMRARQVAGDLSRQMATNMEAEYVRMYGVNSAGDYFVGKVFTDNFAAKVYKTIMKKCLGLSDLRDQLMEQAYVEYMNTMDSGEIMGWDTTPAARVALKAGTFAGQMAADWYLYGGGKILGGLLTRATGGAVSMASNSLGRRILYSAIESGGSFAGAGMAEDAVQQWSSNRDGFSVMEVLETGGEEFAKGAGMGVSGQVFGIGGKALARTGNRYADATISHVVPFVGEVGGFTTMGAIEEYMKNGVSILDYNWGESLVENMANIAALKGTHALKDWATGKNRQPDIRFDQQQLDYLKGKGFDFNFDTATGLQNDAEGKALKPKKMGKEERRQKTIDQLKQIVDRQDIPQTIKAVALYEYTRLTSGTGKLGLVKPADRHEIQANEDGSMIIKVYDADNGLVDERRMNQQEGAKYCAQLGVEETWNKAHTAEKGLTSSMSVLDEAVDAACEKMRCSWKEAIDAMNMEHDGTATEEQKQICDQIRQEAGELVASGNGASMDRIADEIKGRTGVDVKGLMQNGARDVDMNKPEDVEKVQMALNEYLGRLGELQSSQEGRQKAKSAMIKSRQTSMDEGRAIAGIADKDPKQAYDLNIALADKANELNQITAGLAERLEDMRKNSSIARIMDYLDEMEAANPAAAAAAREYITLLDRMSGYAMGVDRQINDACRAEADRVKQLSFTGEDGRQKIQSAVQKDGKTLYVKSKADDGTCMVVVMTADGKPVIDGSTGKPMVMQRRMDTLELGEEEDVQQHNDDYRQRMTSQIWGDRERALNHHPDTPASLSVGSRVMAVTNDGREMTMVVTGIMPDGRIQTRMAKEGRNGVLQPYGDVSTFDSEDDLKSFYDAYNQKRDEGMERGRQDGMLRTAEDAAKEDAEAKKAAEEAAAKQAEEQRRQAEEAEKARIKKEEEERKAAEKRAEEERKAQEKAAAEAAKGQGKEQGEGQGAGGGEARGVETGMVIEGRRGGHAVRIDVGRIEDGQVEISVKDGEGNEQMHSFQPLAEVERLMQGAKVTYPEGEGNGGVQGGEGQDTGKYRKIPENTGEGEETDPVKAKVDELVGQQGGDRKKARDKADDMVKQYEDELNENEAGSLAADVRKRAREEHWTTEQKEAELGKIYDEMSSVRDRAEFWRQVRDELDGKRSAGAAAEEDPELAVIRQRAMAENAARGGREMTAAEEAEEQPMTAEEKAGQERMVDEARESNMADARQAMADMDEVDGKNTGRMLKVADRFRIAVEGMRDDPQSMSSLMDLDRELRDRKKGLKESIAAKVQAKVDDINARRAKVGEKSVSDRERAEIEKEMLRDERGKIDRLLKVAKARMGQIQASAGATDLEEVENGDGEVVMTKAGGDVEFNIASAMDTESREYIGQVIDMMEDMGLSNEEARGILDDLDEVANIVMKIARKYPTLREWQSKGVDRVYTEVNKLGLLPKTSAFRNNGEYKYNIDLGSLCTKREALDVLMQKVVDAGRANDLGTTQIQALRDVLKKYGYLVQCDMCFVETKRGRAATQANDFAFEWNAVCDALGLPKVDVRMKHIGDEGMIGTGTADMMTEERLAILNRMADKDISDIAEEKRRHKRQKLDKEGNPKYVKEKGEYKLDKEGNRIPDEVDLDHGITADKAQKIAKVMLKDPRLLGRWNADWEITTRDSDKFETEFSDSGLPNLLAAKFGAATAKPMRGFVNYDPLSWKTKFDEAIRGGDRNKLEKVMANIYGIGGFRGQSFTDFNPLLTFDYVQHIVDDAIRNLPEHQYTKVKWHPMLFGETGMMINMSIVSGTDKSLPDELAGFKRDDNGKFVFNNGKVKVYEEGDEGVRLSYQFLEESFPMEGENNCWELRRKPEYGGRVGVIVVGVGDHQIRQLLRDGDIDMVIPYHASGMDEGVKVKTGLDSATDYTDFQNTKNEPSASERESRGYRDRMDKVKVKDVNGREVSMSKCLYDNGLFSYNMALQVLGDPKKAASAYLAWCDAVDATPKFEQFSKEDGYYKLLEDFRGYDNDGKPVIQGAVRLQLPKNFSQILNEAMKDRAHTEGMLSDLDNDEQVWAEVEERLKYQRLDGDLRNVFIGRLKSVVGKNNVIVKEQSEFMKLVGQALETSTSFTEQQKQLLRTSDGQIYGFMKDGKIYLNENTMNANTPVHEFGHLWAKVVQIKNPELWKRGVKLLEQSEEWQQVLKERAYANIHGDRDAMASEVLSRIIGRMNEDYVRDIMNPEKARPSELTLKEKIWEWLKDVWGTIRDTFSDNYKGLTLEEFQRMPLRDLLDKKAGDVFKKKLSDLRKAKKIGGEMEIEGENMEQDLADSFKEAAKQDFGSAATSINGNKLPAGFALVDRQGGWKEGGVNLDMGGGRFDNATHMLSEKGVENLVFDPYNRDAEHNRKVAERVRQGGVDSVTCNNCLNVINTRGARSNVILQCAKALKEGGTAYFTIYEGNGSGEGKVSKNDCWQENRKTRDYVDEIAEHFGDVEVRGKLIIARDPLTSGKTSVWNYDASGEQGVQFMNTDRIEVKEPERAGGVKLQSELQKYSREDLETGKVKFNGKLMGDKESQYRVIDDGKKKFRNWYGSTQQRYRGNVGKQMGGIYLHKDYATEVIPEDVYRRAESAAGALGLKYNCVYYDPKTPDVVRFDEAPDFDSAREPITGRWWKIDSRTGEIVGEGNSRQIWHNKWMWVKDDYKGFDVDEAYEWSKRWNQLISNPDGIAAKWEYLLEQAGLPIDWRGSALAEQGGNTPDGGDGGGRPVRREGESTLDYATRLDEWQRGQETAERMKAVRGAGFKNWFGDWEKEPEKSSKVVDENGEPLVMYHGAIRGKSFTAFDKSKIGSSGAGRFEGLGFNFTPDRDRAAGYANGKENVYEVYLDIKKPITDQKKSISLAKFTKIFQKINDGMRMDERMVWEFNPPRYGWNDGRIKADYQNAIVKVARDIYEYADSDADLISQMSSAFSGDADVFNKVLEKEGYDGILWHDRYSGKLSTAIVFEPSQIKSAERNNGEYSRDNDDIEFMFVGDRGVERSAEDEKGNWRQENKRRAFEMVRGVYDRTGNAELTLDDRRRIKYATGWEQGKDGRWRYEERGLQPDVKGWGDNVISRIKAGDMTLGELLGEDGRELMRMYPELAKFEVNDRTGASGAMDIEGRSLRINLKDLVKRREELGEQQEIYEDSMRRIREAGLDEDTRQRAERVKKEQLKEAEILLEQAEAEIIDTINHEVQHGVQAIEGFAQGGSPEMVERYRQWVDAELLDLNARLQNAGFGAWCRRMGAEKVAEISSRDDFAALEKEFVKSIDDEDERQRLEGEISYSQDKIEQIYEQAGGREAHDNMSAYDWYKSLAGEVEARNAGRRAGMTEDERRSSLGQDTEDVDRDEQIVRYGDEIQEMGSRYNRKRDRFRSMVNGEGLQGNKKALYDVFSDNEGKSVLHVERNDGTSVDVDIVRGREDGLGAKHSLFNHYGEDGDNAKGRITSREIMMIDDVIANNHYSEEGGRRKLYTMDVDGTEVKVLTEARADGKERFLNAYTNRRGSNASLEMLHKEATHTNNGSTRTAAEPVSGGKGTENSGDVQVNREKISADLENEEKKIINDGLKAGTLGDAPNGKDSLLTSRQWVQVRTRNFKRYFGDWEKEPEKSSKVVDENGEPLVMYHGTDSYGFKVFNTSAEWNEDNVGSHFGDKGTAGEFGDEGHTYAVYLNIRNPYETFDFFADTMNNAYLEVLNDLRKKAKNPETKKIWEQIYDVYPQLRQFDMDEVDYMGELFDNDEGLEKEVEDQEWKLGDGIEVHPDIAGHRDAMVRIMREMLKAEGYDGLRYQNWYEGDGKQDCWVALESNQIKSASEGDEMENNGDFDPAKPEIDMRSADERRNPLKWYVEYYGADREQYESYVKRCFDHDNRESAQDLAFALQKAANEKISMVRKGKVRGTDEANRMMKEGGELLDLYRHVQQMIDDHWQKEAAVGRSLGLKSGNLKHERVREIFADLNGKNENEEERRQQQELFDRIMSVAERLGVECQTDGRLHSVLGNEQGGFVHFNLDYMNSDASTDADKAVTMLHELIHGVTTYMCFAVDENMAKERKWAREHRKVQEMGLVTDEMKQAVKNLNDIYAELKARADRGELDGELYGLKNMREMLAEMANPRFRDEMKKQGLWVRMKDAVKRIVQNCLRRLDINVFNSEGVESSTAKDEIMRNLDFMLENASGDIFNVMHESARRLGRNTSRTADAREGEEDQLDNDGRQEGEGETGAADRRGSMDGGLWRLGKKGRLEYVSRADLEREDAERERKEREASAIAGRRAGMRDRSMGGRQRRMREEGALDWQDEVAIEMAGVKLLGEDRQDGTRGLIAHTTGRKADVKGWLAAGKAREDAETPEEMAERIYDNMDEGMRANVDAAGGVQAITDEIIANARRFANGRLLMDDVERRHMQADVDGMDDDVQEQKDEYAKTLGYDSWDEYQSVMGANEAEEERLEKEARDRYLRSIGYEGEEDYQRQMEGLNRAARKAALEQQKRAAKEELIAAVKAAETRPEIPKRRAGEDLLDYAQRVALADKAQREYDRNHPVETLTRRDAMRAVRERIGEELKRDSVSAMDKRTLNSILRTLESTDVVNLQESIDEATRLVRHIEMKANQNDIDRLLKLKVDDQNQKGVSIAKNVDDRTRKLMKALEGRIVDIETSGLEDQIHELRSENWHLRDERRSLDPESARAAEIDRRLEENNGRIDDLERQREQKLIERTQRGDVSVDRAIDRLKQRMDDEAAEGREASEDEVVQLTALQLHKMVLDGKQLDGDIMQMEQQLREVRMAKAGLWEQYRDGLGEAKAAVDEEGSWDNVQRWRQISAEYTRKRDAYNLKIAGLNRLITEAEAQKIQSQEAFREALGREVEGGKESLLEQVKSMQKRRLDILSNSMHDIIGGKERATLDDKDNEKNTDEKWYRKIFTSALSSFEYMAQSIATKTLGKDSYFYKHFVEGEDGVIEAKNTYIQSMRSAREKLDEKVKEIFSDKGHEDGSGRIESFADWWNEMDRTPKDGKWGKAHGVKMGGRWATTGISVIDMNKVDEDGQPTGERVERTDLTKGQATYVYMLWKMPDGRAKLEMMGFDEDSMEEVKDYIGERNVRMADWVQKDFLVEERDKINRRHLEMYNTSMAEIENYVPIKINSGAVREEIDLSGDTGQGAGKLVVKTGAIINRKANTNPIDLNWSAAKVIWDHLDEVEDFYAFAPVRRDLGWVLSSQAFRNQLNKNRAGSFKRLVEAAKVATHADDRGGAGSLDRVMGTIQKGLVGGNIAFRNNTALKQMLSVPAFLGYSQDPRFLGAFVKNMFKIYGGNAPALVGNMATFGVLGKKLFTDKEKSKGALKLALTDDIKWCMDNLPDFWDRVLKGTAGESSLDTEGVGGKVGRFIDGYLEVGMRANQMVDALTCAIGIKTIYEYKMARAKDRARELGLEGDERSRFMAEERRKALMEATIYYNGTQQSNHEAFLSPQQVGKSFVDRSLSLYQNASIGYARRFVSSVKDLNRLAHWDTMVGNYARKELRERGIDPANATEEEMRQARSRAGGYLFKEVRKKAFDAAWYGFVLNFVWDFGGKGLLGMLQDDDDEEKSLLERLAQLITYPARGTAGMNMVGSIATGGKLAMGLQTDEINDFLDNWKKAQEKYGLVSPEIGYLCLERAARFGGVKLDVWSNTYLGVERAINELPTGDRRDMVIDLMFLLNSPNSQRAAVAKKLYREKYGDNWKEHVNDYLHDVEMAMKYIDDEDQWADWIPNKKTLTAAMEGNLKKEFIERCLTPQEKEWAKEKKDFDEKLGAASLEDLGKMLEQEKSEVRREEIIKQFNKLDRQEHDSGEQKTKDEVEEQRKKILGTTKSEKEEWEQGWISQMKASDMERESTISRNMRDEKAKVDKIKEESARIRKQRGEDAADQYEERDENAYQLDKYDEMKELRQEITDLKKEWWDVKRDGDEEEARDLAKVIRMKMVELMRK